MKPNKKYLVPMGVAALALAVGGTAAFFTSTDSITNPFKTGSTTPEGEDKGINVVEDFRTLDAEEEYLVGEVTYKNTNPIRGFEEYDDNPFISGETTYGELQTPTSGPTEMLPGELFIKAMRVESEANYSQYLRVKVTVTIAGVTGEESGYNGEYILGVSTLPTDLIIETDTDGWTFSNEDYNFYYDTAFGPTAVTNDIVKSVMLDGVASGNEWKNATITVKLEADAIQATTDAWASWAATDVTEPTLTPTPGP